MKIFVTLISLLLSVFEAASVDAVQAESAPTLLIPSAHQGGLEGGIKLLATHPQSNWFATLGEDGTLCIWDAVDAHFLAKHPAKEVQALAILPNSHLAVVASIDTLRILDVDTFTTVKNVALRVPISRLFSTPEGRLFALTYRGLDRIDPTTLAITPLAAIERGLILRSAMSPDGNLVGVVLTGPDANRRHLVIFDTRDGTTQLSKEVARVEAIDLSSDLVVIGSNDTDDIRVSDGQILALHLPDGNPVMQLPVKHSSFALLIVPGESAHGRIPEVVSAFPGGTERVDLTTSKIVLHVAESDTFSHLAPLGTSLIAAGYRGVPSVCNAATLQCVASDAIHGSAITQVKTQGKDGLLLFDSQGDAIRMGETLQIEKLYPSPTLALLPKLKGQEGVFALGQSNDTFPGLFVNSALAPTHPAGFVMIAHSVTLAASRDGRYLVTRAPFAQTNPLRAEIYELGKLTSDPLAAPPQLGTWLLTSEQAAPIDVRAEYQFRFTSDSKVLVAVNVMTGSVHRYEMATGRELPVTLPPPPVPTAGLQLGLGPVSAWSFRADGQSVVLARYQTLQIIRFDDARSATSIAVKQPIESVTSGEGDRTYISLEDGSVLRWDTTSEPVSLTTLPYPCTSLLYLPERKWLVANSADGSTRFLDADSGHELMSVVLFPNGKDWLLWTSNGLFDASDGGWSGVRWKLAANTFGASEPVEDFFDQFYVPGLAAAVLNAEALEPGQPLALKERRTATIHLTPGQPTGGKVSVDLLATAPPGVAVRDIHLFRNGVLLKTWSGSVQPGSHLKYTADLVAGHNRFRAYAFNQNNVKTSNATAEMTAPQTLGRPGDLYVVAIGINEYQNKSFHLNYARQDALLTAAALKAQRQDIKLVATQSAARADTAGNAQEATPVADLMPSSGDIHITTLIDADATRDRILKTLSEVSRQVRPEDSLLIYYAGHGIAVGDRYYLLPQDLRFNGAPSQLRENAGGALERSAISDVDLTDVLSGEQAATAALIIDACQSGEIIGDKLAQHRGPANSRGLAQLAYDKRIFVLAASLSTQNAAEQQELEHGVLTYRLVMEGLLQDKASPQEGFVGPGTTTLAQWLSWVANTTVPGATREGDARGFVHAQTAWNLKIPVQQPRLFAPPEFASEPQPQITVALRALPLDPQTLTAEGYIPSQTVAPSAPSSPTHKEVSFHLSTLGWMRSGVVSADGHRMIGVNGNRIVELDLDHGAVRWTQKMGEDLVSLDVSYNGEIAVLGQSGKVSVVTHSTTPETHELLQGSGFTLNGLVRWVGRDGDLLVLTDHLLALYTPRGELLHSIDLSGKGLRAPTVSARGDWLFAEDWSGRVLTYQVPSLTPGPVVEAIQANTSAPVATPYSISSAVDPSVRHLIRIRSDGSLVQTLLPQTPDSHPLIQSGRTQAAHFSVDGSRLFVADSAGTVRVIDTSSGTEQKSWPSELETVETLATDAGETVLVAMGNGAAAVWKLPGGELQTLIPGGQLLTTVRPLDAGSVNVMMADHDSVRTFRLPDAAVTSSVARPRGVFLNHNRLVGKTEAVLAVWDIENVSHSKQLTVPAGEGRLDITPDGRLLAWAAAAPAAASLQVLDASRGATVKSMPLSVYPDAFALPASGQWLLYLLGEHLHKVPLDGGPATEIVVPQAPCCRMELSEAGGELLLASAQQGRVMLYDLDKRRVRRTLQMHDAIETVNFVPSTDDVVAVTLGGDVHLWKPSTTEEPQRLGTVEGHVTGVGFTRSALTVLVGSDRGEMGWFSLRAADWGHLATTTWLESTHSWLTVAHDGRFDVTGDISTPLGILDAEHSTWRPASQQPGFTPGLIKQLAAR